MIKLICLVLILISILALGCQLEPQKLSFNPPHLLEDVFPAVPKLSFKGFANFKAFYARDINGMNTSRLIRNFLGGPNKKQDSIDEVQSWIYIFQRVKPGVRPPHDARKIEFVSDNPPNIALAIVIKDNRVHSTQAAWFGWTPVSVSDVIRFLGAPDKRQVITGGEEFFYRYVCFTSHKGSSDETSYVITESIVKITFQASGNYNGFDIFFVDRSKVVIFPDGTVQDPAMNIVWTLTTPSESERKAGLDLITYGMRGLKKIGDVSAAFGWATDVITAPRSRSAQQTSGAQVQTSIYPLKRDGSPPVRMVVTSRAKEETLEVVSLGLSWEGDMPRTTQELKVRFGEPDRIEGSIASGFQRWIYNFQLMVEPFVLGHHGRNKFGLSIIFSVRSAINLDPQVEIRKLYF